MEKTNWNDVYNCLVDAANCFMSDSPFADAVQDLICALIDLVRSYK